MHTVIYLLAFKNENPYHSPVFSLPKVEGFRKCVLTNVNTKNDTWQGMSTTQSRICWARPRFWFTFVFKNAWFTFSFVVTVHPCLAAFGSFKGAGATELPVVLYIVKFCTQRDSPAIIQATAWQHCHTHMVDKVTMNILQYACPTKRVR